MDPIDFEPKNQRLINAVDLFTTEVVSDLRPIIEVWSKLPFAARKRLVVKFQGLRDLYQLMGRLQDFFGDTDDTST